MVDYDSGTSETSQDSMGDKFASITDGVKKIGIVKIILLVIIVAGAVWFLSQPKPGELNVTVVELDGNKNLDGAEVSLFLGGEQIGESQYTDSGSATFLNVPSAAQIKVRAGGIPGYEDSIKSITLKSGELGDLKISMSRKESLSFSKTPTDVVTLGPGCTKKLEFEVSNDGNNPVEVELIGEGDLQNMVSSDKKTITAKAKETIPVTVTSSISDSTDTTKPGIIRAKYYSSPAQAITINLVEPSKLDVTSSIGRSDVSPGDVVKELISVKNIGDKEIINGNDITITTTGDIKNYDAQAAFDDPTTPLRPDETKIMTFTFTVPATTSDITGQIIISTPCKAYPIQVRYQPRSES